METTVVATGFVTRNYILMITHVYACIIYVFLYDVIRILYGFIVYDYRFIGVSTDICTTFWGDLRFADKPYTTGGVIYVT